MSRRDDFSMEREPAIELKVPEYMYQSLYKVLVDDENLYTIVSVGDSKPKMFFSPYGENRGEYVSRVFFRKKDAYQYLQELKLQQEKVSDLSIWETKRDKLVESYAKILDKTSNLTSSTMKYFVISSIFYLGQIRDMEVFWTNQTDNML